MNPLVSVVIPTRNRPVLVLRTLASVFAQTMRNLEAIVVLDGPDPATAAALAAMQREEPRLRFLELDRNQGGSAARNRGIEAAHGQWIALLDDDDEWLAGKLGRQMAEIEAMDLTGISPVVATSLYAQTGDGRSSIWPRTHFTQPLSEWLFCRKSLAYGDAVMQTSTLMAPRAFFLRVPFTEGLKRRQDYDWVLRAANEPDVVFRLIHEPLVLWKIWYDTSSVSNRADWRHSLEWITARTSLITRRAHSGFVASEVARDARDQKAWRQFLPLLWEMTWHGNPRLFDFAIYLSSWVPASVRRFVGRITEKHLEATS